MAPLHVQNLEVHQVYAWCFKNRGPRSTLISLLASSQKICFSISQSIVKQTPSPHRREKSTHPSPETKKKRKKGGLKEMGKTNTTARSRTGNGGRAKARAQAPSLITACRNFVPYRLTRTCPKTPSANVLPFPSARRSPRRTEPWVISLMPCWTRRYFLSGWGFRFFRRTLPRSRTQWSRSAPKSL